MHPALEFPEVVAYIVTAIDKIKRRSLFECILVNKAFSQEAVRLIWNNCTSIFLHQLKGLVGIFEKDVQRAQYYANFIQHLQLSFIRDLEWNQSLASLQYPQLKDFCRSDNHDIFSKSKRRASPDDFEYLQLRMARGYWWGLKFRFCYNASHELSPRRHRSTRAWRTGEPPGTAYHVDAKIRLLRVAAWEKCLTHTY